MFLGDDILEEFSRKYCSNYNAVIYLTRNIIQSI